MKLNGIRNYRANESFLSIHCTYAYLSDIAYHFVQGTELLSRIDSAPLDPMIAQVVGDIRPLAQIIGPYAKQLWFYLENESED